MSTVGVETAQVELPPRLGEARSRAYTELERADTKANHLLSATSILIAAAALVLGKENVRVPATSIIGLCLAGVTAVAAVVLLLTVICPRLGRTSQPGTWLHAARHGAASLLDDSVTVQELADDTVGLCRAAVRKHQRLAVAVWLIVATVILLAISLALALV